MTNSIILQNLDTDSLRAIIGEVVAEKLQSFNPKQQPKENYITRRETAEKIRISLPTLNELTKSGRLNAYRIGGRVLYRESEIEKSLESIAKSRYRRP